MCITRLFIVALAATLIAASPAPPVALSTSIQACTKDNAMRPIADLEGSSFPTGGAAAVQTPKPKTAPVPSPAPDATLKIIAVTIHALDDQCPKAHDIRIRLRTALSNISKSDFVAENARVKCGLYIKPDPDVATRDLRRANIKIGSMTFMFHFFDVAPGEEGLSIVPATASGDSMTIDTQNGDATSASFTAGAHLGGCTEKFNVDEPDRSDAIVCTWANAMKNLLSLEGSPFPTPRPLAGVPAGALPAPDAKLTITRVSVTTNDSECATARNVRLRLRVAAVNDSSDLSFILQRARVVCGLFLKPLPEVQQYPPLKDEDFKLSSLNFRFVFLNIHHGEAGLSVFSTGVENDPTQTFTIEGEANTSDFIANAKLGDCVERFNV